MRDERSSWHGIPLDGPVTTRADGTRKGPDLRTDPRPLVLCGGPPTGDAHQPIAMHRDEIEWRWVCRNCGHIEPMRDEHGQELVES